MERKMIMRSKHLLLILVALVVTPGITQSTTQDHPPAPKADKKPAASAYAAQQNEDEGDRIFQQNCSRCHDAPESLSPRISGTIVRHMRSRASLSQHDEEAVLRFLNP
jgi:cytochrome c5